MARKTYSAFKGIVPAVSENLLSSDYARIANDVKLCHGRLDPWRTPEFIQSTDASAIYMDGCRAVTSTACDAKFTPVEPCDFIIESNDDCPVKVDLKTCERTVLGFPCPEQPTLLMCPLDVEDGPFTEMRSYVIAYSDGSDVGASGRVSVGCKANKGDKTVISLPQPDPKYDGAKEICIYRSMATWDVTKGMWEPQGGSLTNGLHDVTTEACFFMVDCVPVGTTEYCDEGLAAVELMGDALVSEDYGPPPEGICIIGMTQLGSLVGILDDCIYFSERNACYAWPEKYKTYTGCKLIGGCVDKNTVFIGTDGPPIVIQDYPEATETYCREPQFASKPVPMASAKSAVCLNGTMIYASPWGFVALGPDTSVTEISMNEWCHDNFESICPDTIRAACYRNDYFFTSDNFSGIYTSLLGAGDPILTTTSVCPDCWVTTKQGYLYYLDGGTLYKWDSGSDYMELTYETAAEFERSCNTVARVVHATKRKEAKSCGTLFEYFADGCSIFERTVDHSECFNIKRAKAEEYSVRVTSKSSIKRIEVGPNRACFAS